MKNRYNWYKAFKRAKNYRYPNLQRIADTAKFAIDFYNIDICNLKNIRIKDVSMWPVWASMFDKYNV